MSGIDENLTLSVVPSVLSFRAAEWNRLVEAAVPAAVPMMRWEWYAAFEKSGAAAPQNDFTPHHMALHDGRRLVAVAPLYWKRTPQMEWTGAAFYQSLAARIGFPLRERLVGLIPFTPVSGYRFLLDPYHEPEILTRTLLAAMQNEAKQRQTIVQLSHVDLRANDFIENLLRAGFISEESYTYRWLNRGFETMEDFLKAHPSRRRAKMHREMQAMKSEGMTLVSLRAEEITREHLAIMHRCYVANQEKHYGAPGPLTAPFWELLVESFRPFLRLVLGKKGDEFLGMSLYVEGSDGFFGRWWGALREVPNLHFNVCYYEPIRLAIREKKAFIDPGFQGDFKRWRGFEKVAMQSFVGAEDPILKKLIAFTVKALNRGDEE